MAVTLGRSVLGAFFMYPELSTPHPLNVAAAILQHVALALITMALLAAWHEEATGSLQHLASTDGLTGLLNRRGCMEHAALAVILLDLDHFKCINDALGHEAGDKVLQLTAEQLRLCLRQTDLSCRDGGEEFLLVLRHCDQAQAVEVDGRLRTLLLSMPLTFPRIGRSKFPHPSRHGSSALQ